MRPSEFFERRRVFRFDEFLTAHQVGGATEATTHAVLRYHVGTGKLLRVRRGLYVNSAEPDPWLLASHATADAVIAYEGALAFHDLCPFGNSISFLTEERTTRFNFGEVFYGPVLVPGALKNKRSWGGHIVEVEHSGEPLKVTSPERTLVDLLDRLDLAVDSHALWDSFTRLKLDWDAMAEYARRLENRLVVGRLAVFLQLLGAKNRFLDTLDSSTPRSMAYFNKHERDKGGALFPRWNLIVSRSLMQHIHSGKPRDADREW